MLPFVPSMLFGLTVYLVLELVFGSYGFVAYHVVDSYKQEIEEGRSSVENREQQLRVEINRLQTDPDAVRRAAHDLGLVGEREGVIRVSGYRYTRHRGYDPGRPAPIMRTIADNRPLFRGIGLTAALLFLLVQLLTGPKRYSGKRERHSR